MLIEANKTICMLCNHQWDDQEGVLCERTHGGADVNTAKTPLWNLDLYENWIIFDVNILHINWAADLLLKGRPVTCQAATNCTVVWWWIWPKRCIFFWTESSRSRISNHMCEHEHEYKWSVPFPLAHRKRLPQRRRHLCPLHPRHDRFALHSAPSLSYIWWHWCFPLNIYYNGEKGKKKKKNNLVFLPEPLVVLLCSHSVVLHSKDFAADSNHALLNKAWQHAQC